MLYVQCEVYSISHWVRCNIYVRMMLEACTAAAVVAAAGCM